jgi:hypothetical protein
LQLYQRLPKPKLELMLKPKPVPALNMSPMAPYSVEKSSRTLAYPP